MGWILRAATVAVVVATAGLTNGPLAHADDASYLASLDAHGAYRSGPPNSRLAAGHKFCGELRSGASPDQVVAHYRSLPTFGLPGTIDDLRQSLPQVVDSAQHELCPDTLH